MRGPDGRQLALLAIAPIGAPATLVDELAVHERQEPALLDLGLQEGRAERTLDDLERGARRGEEHLVTAAGEPQRSPDAAGEVEDTGIPFVDPRRRHRADQLLEHLGARAVRVDEGEDHLGVDRHLGLVPVDAVTQRTARRRSR